MSIILICAACLLAVIIFMFGFGICAVLTMGKVADMQAELIKLTDEELLGSPDRPRFDKRA